MKQPNQNAAKELYSKLRNCSCADLSDVEIPRFDRASASERERSVGLIRAVGVVFAESGTPEQKQAMRAWLRGLLKDPAEKIRRYAMRALPKLGADTTDEAALLSVLQNAETDRERKFLAGSLGKVGGKATLKAVKGAGGALAQTELRVKAAVARSQVPSVLRMDSPLATTFGLKLHFRCRKGLEDLLCQEIAAESRFSITEVTDGLVVATSGSTGKSGSPFTLGEVYALRCFATVGIVLGEVPGAGDLERMPVPDRALDGLAAVITSPLARQIFEAFTSGPFRYRLEFAGKGHQRGAIRRLADRTYARCPEILNDAYSAPWTLLIHSTPRGALLELTPRFRPDPRFNYRLGDVPAASHPPLAACMARLSGKLAGEVVWDPFCGSGVELIERARLGGVERLIGTDLSPDAIATAQANLAAANLAVPNATFVCRDFRDFKAIKELGANSVSLVITNPPMGHRVPVADLHGLIQELFSAAATVLRPEGRLVFANPVPIEHPHPRLTLEYRRLFDLGPRNCSLEMYRKVP